MLRLADSFCRSGVTIEMNATRIQRYDVLLGGCDDHARIAKAEGRQPMGYIMANPADGWHTHVRNYGYKKYLDERGLVGLELDCVFDIPNTVEVCKEIAAAIAPLPIIPNYGDWASWMGLNAANKERSLALNGAYEWAFVQNAHDMRYHTETAWKTLKHHANVRLSAGKELVFGIYDPERKQEMLSALLTHSYEHPNLYWHYNTTTRHPMELEDQWCSYWDLAK